MEHSVNVLQFAEARASEIGTLMNELKSASDKRHKSWFQKMPHYMRRRGASLDPRRIPRKLRTEKSTAQDKNSTKKKKVYKKKPKDMPAEYAGRSAGDSRWLETHVWHAKRFKMDSLWGYRLPLHSNDRKLGVTHKAAAYGTLALDLSYYNCIELQGQQEKLFEHLSRLCDASAGHAFESEMFLNGTMEGHTILYHPDKCPFEAVGPVTFIWRPLSNFNAHSQRVLWIWCHPSFHDELVQMLKNIFCLEEAIEAQNTEERTFSCKLTRAKVAHLYRKEKRFIGKDIQMMLLKDSLARHRLIGPKSKKVLSSILQIAQVSLQNSNVDDPVDSVVDSEVLTMKENEKKMQPDKGVKNEVFNQGVLSRFFNNSPERKADCSVNVDAVVSESKIKKGQKRLQLEADSSYKNQVRTASKKPKIEQLTKEIDVGSEVIGDSNTKIKNKLLKKSKNELGDELSQRLHESEKGEHLPKKELNRNQLWWECYYSHPNTSSAYEKKKKLWTGLSRLPPRSGVLGLTVRDPRLAFGRGKQSSTSEENCVPVNGCFSTDVSDSALWEKPIRDEVTATKLSEHGINEERSQCIVSPDFGRRENRIPVLLIHQPESGGFASGWDVILPLGWSFEFWRCYEKQGCRSGGLRDLNFINLEAGRPSFPQTCPDTRSGQEFEEKIRHDGMTKMFRRPKNQRVNFCKLGVPTPFFMDWNVLIEDWKKETDIAQLLQIFTEDCEKKSPENGTKIRVAECSQDQPKPTNNLIKCVDVKGSETESCTNTDAVKSCQIQRTFCVFRKSELWELSSFCQRLKTATKHGLDELRSSALKKSFIQIVSDLASFDFIDSSLLLVRIKCLNKGSPPPHSNLYLLDEVDIQMFQSNHKFLGPTELSVQRNKPTVSSKTNNKANYLLRPILDTLISSCSRRTLGYLSEGGYSSHLGCGFGIGHCSLLGFMVLLNQSLQNGLPPMLLWREQNTYHYRLAHVEVIESY